MKAAPSVVSPLQPNDSGSQISKSIDLPPVARGLKLLSRVGLRFAQNALKTDHDIFSFCSIPWALLYFILELFSNLMTPLCPLIQAFISRVYFFKAKIFEFSRPKSTLQCISAFSSTNFGVKIQSDRTVFYSYPEFFPTFSIFSKYRCLNFHAKNLV